jgi:hypothetical protein
MRDPPCASDIMKKAKKHNLMDKWYERFADDIEDIISMYMDIVMNRDNCIIKYNNTLRQDLIEWLYDSSLNKDLKNNLWL